MAGFKGWIKGKFTVYETPVELRIENTTVAVLKRLLQFGILAYVLIYPIIYKKGYQEFDEVVSVALTRRLKGVTYLTQEDLNAIVPGVTDRVWDAVDSVVPPKETNAFFVTTNVDVTLQQEQGVCAEDPSLSGVHCQPQGTDCTPGEPVLNGNGVRTGECVRYPNTDNYTCAVHAWCPVGVGNTPLDPPAFIDSRNFTVLIKNWITFPKFNVKSRNIIDEIRNREYLKTCRYNSSDPIDRFCPVFQLGVIAEEAGVDYEEIAAAGGVIAVNIHWDCNLDYSISKCVPKYTFRRLDDKNAMIAKGWNFRYANYYREGGRAYRDLVKAYGIHFSIKVTGYGGKFDLANTLLNFGAGLGLAAIIPYVCDFIVTCCLKNRQYYESKKYVPVSEPNKMNPPAAANPDTAANPDAVAEQRV